MRPSLLAILLLTLSTHSWSQYHEYPLPDEEQHGQQMIPTQDGGFLLVASKSCYTPGTTVIEGCPTGTYFMKLNAAGDTLWTSQVSPDAFHDPIIFENADGTFTLISSYLGTYKCGIYFLGGIWGLSQIITINISASGELLSNSSYPEECELSLQSAVRLSDNRFAVLAIYTDISYWDFPENRLYVMDKDLTILDSINMFIGDMNSSQLFLNRNNELVVLYSEKDSSITMNVYDTQLNLLQSYSNPDLKQSCFSRTFTDHALVELDNGNMVTMCSDWVNGYYVGDIALFDDQLQLLSQRKLNLYGAKDMVAVNQERVVIVSQNIDLSDDKDIQLTYYSTSGDSLESTTISRPGNQRPNDLVLLNSDKVAITGNVNCCSEPDTIGPSNSFLYLGELSTSIGPIHSKEENSFILPNPAVDFANIILNNVISDNYNKLVVLFYSISGSLINQIEIENATQLISLHHLLPGIYIVIVKNENEILLRTKLVKL